MRRGLSLRAQVTLVVALVAALPNVVLVVAVWLPSVWTNGTLPAGAWNTVGIWLGGVVVLSAAVGYLGSGQLLAPLTRVTRDVEALPLAAPRIAAARLPMSGQEPREVAALKRSFNGLLEQVQLEQSRRNAFTAALMHDLKTPLVAANHLLEVVRDSDDLSREQRVEVVSRLTTENQALIDLVQRMVDAHRLEREEVQLHPEEVALRELVGGIAERLEPLLQQRGVGLEVRGEARAQVDPKELERALYNLLSNAARYAEHHIEVELFPGMVRIRDDGPGLPEPLERLAQPFAGKPVDIAGKRFTAGTGGLGLYIARRVLEAHGGQLVTEATGPGGTVLLAYLGKR